MTSKASPTQRIRRACLEDREALTDLCLRSKQSNGYDDTFMDMCREELTVREEWILRDAFWIMEASNGKICGCIRLHIDVGTTDGEIETCFVDPLCQKQGIARLLIETLFSFARELGLHRLWLDADPFAEPFYQKMGFETVDRSPSGSIPGRFLPRMSCTLIPEAAKAVPK